MATLEFQINLKDVLIALRIFNYEVSVCTSKNDLNIGTDVFIIGF